MRVFINESGMIDIDGLSEKSTVEELLNEVDLFLDSHPLNCEECQDSCCRRKWSVEVDNVCANRLCNWDRETVSRFIQERLVKKENIFFDFDQYVLDKDSDCFYITELNRCQIYKDRPIICRLFICREKSKRYNLLRQIVGSTYLTALVLEDALYHDHLSEEIVELCHRNPVVYAKDYHAEIYEIIHYAEEEGWIEAKERDLLIR